MTPIKKFIFGITLAFILIFIAVLFFIFNLMTKSLPTTSGVISSNKVVENVDIHRNEFDVPYIIANNEHDLMFAFGFTIAQDRLWQIDLERRLGQGRLSEIFGDQTLELDAFSRTVGFERIAAKIKTSLSQDSRQILEAYADGINYYIETHKDKLPVEFDMMKYEPEKWEIEHSLIILRLFGWEMNFSWWSDLLMGEILDKFGEKKASEIFPSYSQGSPIIVKTGNELFSSTLSRFINAHKIASRIFGKSLLAGSNSWVIAGEKSKNGLPLLANDPHLVYSIPSRWYLISLHSGSYDVSGATIPGIPAIIIGNNGYISWGITNGMIDECDFYIENLDTTGANLYFHNNYWEKLDTLQEKIIIKHQDPFYLELHETKNGPIVSSFTSMRGVYDFKPQNLQLSSNLVLKGRQISMRWTGFEVSDEIHGMVQINKAKNRSEFEAGVNQIKTPGLNLIYADINNNIGYWLAARIPIRKYNNSFLPVSGTSSEHEWQGYIPEGQLPRLWNPPEKFIATANNKIIENHQYNISGLWESPSRIERITEILKTKEKFSLSDFQQMQLDVISPNAREIVPVILNVLKGYQNQDAYLQQTLTYLKNWDYSISKASIPAAIFNVFFIKMLKNTFEDEMGKDLFERYCFLVFISTNTITKLIIENKSSWFDNINTPWKIENRDDIIYSSFLETLDFLKEKLGNETKNWRWDNLHSLTFRHPFGDVKPLDRIFNVGPYQTDGSNTTINCGYYDFNNPFENVVGPSMRYVIDMSDVNDPLFILTPGESGQPFSPHYQDQINLMLNGNYLPIYNLTSKIEEQKYQILTIKPKK